MNSFDKMFMNMGCLIVAAWVFAATLSVGALGFILWLAYKLVMHFTA